MFQRQGKPTSGGSGLQARCRNRPGIGANQLPEGAWLDRIMARKPRTPAVIALANKMARAIWAKLMKKENYQEPARAIVA